MTETYSNATNALHGSKKSTLYQHLNSIRRKQHDSRTVLRHPNFLIEKLKHVAYMVLRNYGRIRCSCCWQRSANRRSSCWKRSSACQPSHTTKPTQVGLSAGKMACTVEAALPHPGQVPECLCEASLTYHELLQLGLQRPWKSLSYRPVLFAIRA